MILVAPTAMKGTIPARAVTRALARGARASGELVIELPLSDGGSGLIDALAQPTDKIDVVPVAGPLGGRVDARLLRREASVLIESADACGLHLVPQNQRDPWRANTRGVGELIRHATQHTGNIVVGLGGSATVDAGIGMAAELGWRFFDNQGRQVQPVPARLGDITSIATAPHVPAEILALADVNTPLTGAHGAARVFGPQKGVPSADIDRLDGALHHLADVVRRDLGIELHALRSGGAAGGLGAGLVAFLGARIVSGSAWVLDQVGFAPLLERARLLVTAEGSYDRQSALGKITGVVIEQAAARGVPVLLIAGQIEGPLPPHVYAPPARPDPLTEDDLEHIARVETCRLLGGLRDR